jgi:DNA-binding NarL/FixJ family response regulator
MTKFKRLLQLALVGTIALSLAVPAWAKGFAVARIYIEYNGLGEAIEAQFSRWNLTEAEREVALLLLKGLSLKEIAAVRASTERTVRAQAHSLYSKAELTGRAALSAFFLEDLLAPIERPDAA